MQFRFSIPCSERFLFVVAAQLESQGAAKCDLVPPSPRANQPAAPSGANKETASPVDSLNSAWVRAEQQVNDWRSISLQLPATATAPLTFNIDGGNGGQPQKRAQLVLDRTGNVVRLEPFSSYTRGRQLRSILRFAHTGEVLGVAGQTIAGLVSSGGAFLVVTGLALAIRRLLGWRRRRSKSTAADIQPGVQPAEQA